MAAVRATDRLILGHYLPVTFTAIYNEAFVYDRPGLPGGGLAGKAARIREKRVAVPGSAAPAEAAALVTWAARRWACASVPSRRRCVAMDSCHHRAIETTTSDRTTAPKNARDSLQCFLGLEAAGTSSASEGWFITESGLTQAGAEKSLGHGEQIELCGPFEHQSTQCVRGRR